MCTPLMGSDGNVLGIIYVDNMTAVNSFNDEDLEFLIAFSGIAAVAIENGQLTGTFVQWHDNGRLAAQATMVDGQPDGVCRGWYPSGAPKARVELHDGEVVSREYWEDEGR